MEILSTRPPSRKVFNSTIPWGRSRSSSLLELEVARPILSRLIPQVQVQALALVALLPQPQVLSRQVLQQLPSPLTRRTRLVHHPDRRQAAPAHQVLPLLPMVLEQGTP